MGGAPAAPVVSAAPRAAAGRKVFRSAGAVAIWYAWLVFAALNLIDLGVQGHDHTSAVIAATLLLITGVAFVAALRPRIIADDDAVTLRNPMCDIMLPWGTVTSVDLREVVRVHCRAQAPDPAGGQAAAARIFRSWALQSSHRSRVKAQLRARARTSELTRSSPGFARTPERAQEIATQSAAARAAADLDQMRGNAALRGAPGGPPTVTWSLASVAALLLPALLLAVVSVIP